VGGVGKNYKYRTLVLKNLHISLIRMGRNKREIVRAIGPIKVERKRRRNSVLEDSLTDRLESFADESMTPSEKRLPSSEGPEMRKIIMKILKNPDMSDKLKCEILTRLSK